jgi:hypothetical protein
VCIGATLFKCQRSSRNMNHVKLAQQVKRKNSGYATHGKQVAVSSKQLAGSNLRLLLTAYCLLLIKGS